MRSELSSEQLLSKPVDDMQLNLIQRIHDLRLKLAGMAMHLSAKGELNFAKHMHLSIAQLNTALEEIRWQNVLEFLTELENILLACKIGVNLPCDETTFKNMQLIRAEVSTLIQPTNYVRK